MTVHKDSVSKVNHPAHYNQGGMETVDAIDGLGLDCFYLGNVLKYISRAKYKGTELDDLKKARWYLNRKIENLEKASKEHTECAKSPPASS